MDFPRGQHRPFSKIRLQWPWFLQKSEPSHAQTFVKKTFSDSTQIFKYNWISKTVQETGNSCTGFSKTVQEKDIPAHTLINWLRKTVPKAVSNT